MTMNTVHDRLNQLTDPDAHVRQAAVRAIAGSPSPYVRAVASLLPLLRDPEPEVRPVAVAALREIGDPQAIPAMSAMLTTGNSALRKATLIALLRLDSPHTEQYLTPVFQDTTCSPGLHVYAVKASAKRKMVGPLLIALHNQK